MACEIRIERKGGGIDQIAAQLNLGNCVHLCHIIEKDWPRFGNTGGEYFSMVPTKWGLAVIWQCFLKLPCCRHNKQLSLGSVRKFAYIHDERERVPKKSCAKTKWKKLNFVLHTFICGGVHISEINKNFVDRESLGQIDIKNRGIIYWTKLANQSSQLDWCSSGWVRALNTFGTLLKLSCLQVIVCLHWFCCSDHLWLCDVKTKSENNLTSCSKFDPHGPFKSCEGISENPLN